MFRVDIFSERRSDLHPGPPQVVKHNAIQLRRLEQPSPVFNSRALSFVVAVPPGINVALICGALRCSEALILEPETGGCVSVILRHASEEELRLIIKSYHGCQITDTSIMYILPIADFCFHSPYDIHKKISGETLPSCPACLERIDFSVHPETVWFKSNGWDTPTYCSVCYLLAKPKVEGRCAGCDESQELQVCMICGVIGCGRYQLGHAKAHNDATGHSLCLHLESGRIWDYQQDMYRHRRLKSDGFHFDAEPTGKGELKGEQLLHAKLPDEFSTLRALQCALDHSLATSERDEAQHLQRLIEEWTIWLNQFVAELTSRKNSFELSLESMEQEMTQVLKTLSMEINDLNEEKVEILDDQRSLKSKIKRKRKKLAALEKQIKGLQEDFDLLAVSAAAPSVDVTETTKTVSRLLEKVAAASQRNEELSVQIAHECQALDSS